MKIVNYIKDTKAEMKHVSWPTRRQAILFTVTVIVISVGVALLLGLFDSIFSIGLKDLIIK